MAAVGSLQVVLELNGAGQFTTSVVNAATQLQGLQATATVTATAVNNVNSAMASGHSGVASWVTAIGQARHALDNLHSALGGWLEKIIDINRNMEKTQFLLAGFSTAATQVERLTEGMQGLNAMLDMASKNPFSFGQIQDTFVKLKTAGIDPLKGSMQGLMDAVAAFGGDDQRLKRASYAIQEMAGNGVVSLSNLRRQLGQDIPQALNFMARAMGLTVGELDEKVKKGTLESMNAITLMQDEFARAFGGAALARMATFSGQIAQMTTEIERLGHIAGGVQLGADPKDSSFKSLVDGMRQLNVLLRSNEAQAAAITLNNHLKDVMDTLKAMIPLLPSFTAAINGLTFAFEALALVIAGKVLGALLGFGAGIVGQMATGLVTIGNLIKGIAVNGALLWANFVGPAMATAATAVLGFGARLAATFAIMTAGTGIAGLLAVPLAAVVTTIALIGIPVAAAGAALVWLSYQFKTVEGSAKLALEAADRFRQGDITAGNQDKLAAEIQLLRSRLSLIIETEKKIEEIANKSKMSELAKLPAIGGVNGSPGVRAPVAPVPGNIFGTMAPVDQSGNFTTGVKALADYNAAMEAESERGQRALLRNTTALASSASAAITKAAKEYAQQQLDAAIAESQSLRAAYRDESHKIDEERKAIQAANAGDHTGMQAVNDKQRAEMKKLHDGLIADLRTRIQTEERLLAQAAASNNQLDQAKHKEALAELRKSIAEQEAEEVARQGRWGKAVTNDTGKSYHHQMEAAETALRTMVGQIASLNAQLEGTESHVAKVMTWLGSGGKFNLIDKEEAERLKYAAHLLDVLAEKKKAMEEASKAGQAIDTASSRAAADLEAAMQKLANPNMPEAERRFQQFVATMYRELAKVADAFDKGGISAEDFIKKLNQVEGAINMERQASAISRLTTEFEKAQKAWEASLPAPERAAVVLKRHLEEIQELVAAIALTPGIDLATLDAVYAMQGKIAELRAKTKDNVDAKAGAGAGRASDNALTEMKARLEQINGTIAGGLGHWEKWNALITAQPAKYKALAAQLLEYAQALDIAEATLKKFQAAERAKEALHQRGEDAHERLELLDQLWAKEGKVGAFQLKMMEEQIKTARELRAIMAGPNAATEGAAQAKIAADITAAQTMAHTMEQVLANQKAGREIRLSFETTLSARRAAGEEEIRIERAAMEAAIAASNNVKLTVEQNEEIKRQMYARTAEFYAIKMEELKRKTENGLQKMAREWGDLEKQVGELGSQAFNKLGDMMGDMLSKKKVDWQSFADFVIKQIIRIGIQAALSPLLSAVGGVGSGTGGLGGIGGGIISWIGSLFGGGGDPWANTATSGWQSLNALGGVYTSENLSAYSNKIVSQPTPFLFAAGSLGLMGEAGAEAIMPLRRGADGSLGVVVHSNDNNGSYASQALSAIAKAMATPPVMPREAIPSRSYSTPETRGAAQASNAHTGRSMPATVNVHNQSGQPMQATAGSPRFDAQGMVLDIVIKAMRTPGPMRDAMKGMR